MDVLELKYIRRIRFTLGTVGAWPAHAFDDGSSGIAALARRYGYTCLLVILCSLGMVGQILYLVKNKDTLKLIDAGRTCVPFLMSMVFCQRGTLPLLSSYSGLVKDFVLKFHLKHHDKTTDFSLQNYNRVHKICELATIILHVQLVTASGLFNAVPFYQNYRAGLFGASKPANATFEYSISYYLPVDLNSGVWYTIVCVYNMYVSCNVSVMFCCHDLLICIIVFHIWGHMNVFEHRIAVFPRPESESFCFSREENKEVARKLKEIVQYYIMIKQYLMDTSSAYSITLAVYYLFHIISDCILLLECSTLDANALTSYGPLTLVMYQQLIQLSVIFELIGTKGDNLADAVYGLPWECMDTKNRKTALILLHVVQQPLALKACGMVPVGVQTMMAVIKGSVSYFMMLRTFA